MSRFKILMGGFGAATVATLALAVAPAAARSHNSITVTFAASPKSSAGYAAQKSEIKLHVAGNPRTAFAVVKLHGFSSKVPTEVPNFNATFFNAGTPRWYIKFTNGDYLEGYPTISAWDAHIPSSNGYDYGTYAQMVSYVESHSGGSVAVQRVEIIADTSTPPPYTTILTNVQYRGHYITSG